MKIFSAAFWCALMTVFSAIAPAGRAVISGSTTNTSDPGSTAWDYVGQVGGASGVYLGDYSGTYWVLTAAHVGAHNFTLGGATYDVVSGSSISIYNGDSSQADLTLFRISTAPGLANLSLASADKPVGTTVQMIGFGGGKSWGTNTIFGYTNYTITGTSFGGQGIVTLASGEGGNGAQGVGGDSGGGMFYQKISGEWVLAGILSGIGDISDGTTDYGHGTIAVDLSIYRTQILNDINAAVSAIPEPATWAAGMGAMTLVLALGRRRRRG